MPRRKRGDLQAPNAGAESIPPGATRQAFDREKPPRDGSAEPTAAEDRPPRRRTARQRAQQPEDQQTYEKTREGQRTPAGYESADPLDSTPSGDHRGDSTVGADPDSGAE